MATSGVPTPAVNRVRNTAPTVIRSGLPGNGHAETWDGRVFVLTRGIGNGQSGWFVVAFRPEAVQLDPQGRPEFGPSTRSAPLLLEDDNASNTGMSSHNALAVMPAPGFAENPYRSDLNGSANPSGSFLTYELLVYTQHYGARVPDSNMGRRRARIVVAEPYSSNATVASATFLEPHRELRTHSGKPLKGIEPTLTFDRRLLVWQGDPKNDGAEIDRLVYSYNADPDALTGWSEPRTIADLHHVDRNVVLNGQALHEVFPLAKEPLRAADGAAYAQGEEIRGGYPWISHDGSELFYTAADGGIPGVNQARRAGLSVVGRWTGYTVRMIDGPANPDRHARGQRPATVRLFFSSPGAAPGFWAPYPELKAPPIPYTPHRPVFPLFGSNTNDYAEVSFEDAVDGDYLLLLRMNELLGKRGRIDPTQTPDTSGNHLTGSLQGARFPYEFDGTDANLGAVGQAIYFGESDKVTVSHLGQLDSPTALTVGAHVHRLFDLSGDPEDRWRYLLHQPQGWQLILEEDGRLRASVLVGGQRRELGPIGSAVPLDRWTHVAFTYDATDGRLALYLDGVLQGSQAFGPGRIDSARSQLILGPGGQTLADPRVPPRGPILMLDEVRVSRVVRTPSELAADAYADVVLAPLSPGGIDLPLGLDPQDLQIPATNPLTREAVRLGEQLFKDPAFSSSGAMSCESCHDPALAFTDGVPLNVDVHGTPLARHTPSVLNRVFSKLQYADGRAESLEAQVLIPFSREMGTTSAQVVAYLHTQPGYLDGFQLAFGAPPDKDSLARALASYVRAQVSGNSPVDRFEAGDRSALTPLEQQGRVLFSGKARCTACHSGPNTTDELFHDTALTQSADLGRQAVTGRAVDRAAIKTPSLRNVGLTAPYMHDGSVPTLADVVELYDQGGVRQTGRDVEIRPLELTVGEKSALVAYLRALDGSQGGTVTAGGTVPTRASAAPQVMATQPAQRGSPQIYSAAFLQEMRNYSEAVFLLLVGRTPTPAEHNHYATQLVRGGHRIDTVREIQRSDPYRDSTIQQGYQRFLARAADPSGLASYRSALAGGLNTRAFWESLAGSAEFSRQRAANPAFVDACYLVCLQRPADASGRATFVGQLDRGQTTRSGVARLLLRSNEFHQRYVDQSYRRVLLRAPDPGGRANSVQQLANGASLDAILASLAASDEYFNRVK